MLSYILAILLSIETYFGEIYYSAKIAEEMGVAAEVRLPDETRCDILTDEYAYEVEWATKWKEAPGQAVLYSIWTDRKPAIILLIRNYRNEKLHILRCKMVCERLNIRLEFYDVNKLEFHDVTKLELNGE